MTKLLRQFSAISMRWLVVYVGIFGALGGTIIMLSHASNPNLTGDENNDGVVNILDLSVVLTNWHTNNTAVDLNGDGFVDVFDLSILLTNWGKTGSISGGPKVTLAVSPSGIATGDSATLAWTSQNMSSCSISPNIGAVGTNGTHDTGTISTTTTFTLTCSGSSGSASAQTTLAIGTSGSSAANVSVNFAAPIQQVTAQSFAIDESGYPGGGPVLAMTVFLMLGLVNNVRLRRFTN